MSESNCASAVVDPAGPSLATQHGATAILTFPCVSAQQARVTSLRRLMYAACLCQSALLPILPHPCSYTVTGRLRCPVPACTPPSHSPFPLDTDHTHVVHTARAIQRATPRKRRETKNVHPSAVCRLRKLIPPASASQTSQRTTSLPAPIHARSHGIPGWSSAVNLAAAAVGSLCIHADDLLARTVLIQLRLPCSSACPLTALARFGGGALGPRHWDLDPPPSPCRTSNDPSSWRQGLNLPAKDNRPQTEVPA